jgi:hypothetical protein
MISIGGDPQQIYYADQYAPISWPEVQMIQFIHGADAIDRVEPFVRVDQHPRAERERLVMKYGEDKVSEVFPRSGPTDMEAPQATLAQGLEWKNPISQEAEITEGVAPPAVKSVKNARTGRFEPAAAEA